MKKVILPHTPTFQKLTIKVILSEGVARSRTRRAMRSIEIYTLLAKAQRFLHSQSKSARSE